MNKKLNLTTASPKNSLFEALEQAFLTKGEKQKQIFLEVLAEGYFKFLFLLCYASVGERLAMDAVQDAFIKVFEKIDVIYHAALEKRAELDDKELDNYIKEYIGRLARNVIIDEYHRKKKYTAELDDVLYDPTYEAEQPNEFIWDTVQILEAPYRMPIIYKYLYGWPCERIAEELQISKKRVYRYLGDGLLMLKQHLSY